MSDQPPPLPLPDHPVPPPMPYQVPFAQPAPNDSPQRLFDTVIGPNVRLKDNVVQLACAIVGGAAGAVAGYCLGGWPQMVFGAIGGLIVALLLSGAVIGLFRLIRGGRW